MALDITVNVNYTPPVADYIEHAATLAQRNSMADAHQVDIDPELGWTGFTSTAGFTTYTATTADELFTALAASSSTATTKKLITCNWNGTSIRTGSPTIGGPGTGDLTAYVNGAKDVGYDTPPHYTKIVSGEGYTPALGIASGSVTFSLSLEGFGFVEIDGLDIIGKAEFLANTGSPIPAIVAIRNCTLRELLTVQTARVLHCENNIFDSAIAGVSIGCQASRIWGNECKNKTLNGDWLQVSSFSQAWKATWDAHCWVAGNIIHTCDAVTDSADHFDWLQYVFTANETQSLNLLVEFNVCNNNTRSSQGFFADGYDAGLPIHICAHNNLMLVNAYWGMLGKDSTGTAEQHFYRNTILSAARPYAPEDTFARLAMLATTPQTTPTTGIYDLRENYCNEIFISAALVGYVTETSNQIITNTAGANYVVDKFTGNGTWGTNAGGYLTYDDPGYGLSRSAAFTAIRDFFEPVGGYRVTGHGCTDPATWPAPGAAW